MGRIGQRPTAWLNLRNRFDERASVVEAGFERIGFNVRHGLTTEPRDGDCMLTWNRISQANDAANQFIARGCKVFVVENSYLGNKIGDTKYYSLALNHHNGAGDWHVGDSSRWDSLGIELRSFRKEGSEVVILPQRGIGEPGVRMPVGFATEAGSRLTSLNKRIRVRPHPGRNVDANPTLDHDLKNACAVATWGSSAAIYALRIGVPVFAFWKNWIAASACRMIDDIASGPLFDEEARYKMFCKLAWAISSFDEIGSGEAFSRLLNCDKARQ